MMYKITNNLVSVPNDYLILAPSFLYFNQLSTRIDSLNFHFTIYNQTMELNPLTLITPDSSTHNQFCKLLDNYKYHTCAL